jgi:hypothetical protein
MSARVKLVRGRSKQSHLVLAWPNVHVFVWVPWAHGSESTGTTIRLRRLGGWDHYRLVLWQRNALTGRRGWKKTAHGERSGRVALRPTITVCELARWRTAPGTADRVGLKAYVRLKVSAGGREVESIPTVEVSDG